MKTHIPIVPWRGIPFMLVLVCGLIPLFFTSEQSAAQASVTITEFSDFQCPYCKRAASVVAQLRQTYGDRVIIGNSLRRPAIQVSRF